MDVWFALCDPILIVSLAFHSYPECYCDLAQSVPLRIKISGLLVSPRGVKENSNLGAKALQSHDTRKTIRTIIHEKRSTLTRP
ncbi:hypothetical protein EDD18DRAFT_474025 [Armillaria luteobubalina]|uniref:Secreted protein n=1 Tax=Armillaria luteobubalina TaxID=153913 RepID=A0AA39QJZ7_9AGAR|nr:hypothetical protein EDD18DRAFT_474025 [Armillaria luteobubalina]